MDDYLHLRVVLQESDPGSIHRLAKEVADPRSSTYGHYAKRETMARWANPEPELRKQVLALFDGCGVYEIANSPLVMVTGSKERLAPLFKEGTLDRVDQSNARGLQIRSWDFGAELTKLHMVVKTIHAVHSAKSAQKSTEASGTAFGQTLLPVRGWLFAHLAQDRVLHHQHGARAGLRSGGLPRLEEGATPEVIRRLYNFPDDADGEGQTIALMSLGSAHLETRTQLDQDLRTFWGALGVNRPQGIESVSVGPPADMEPNALFRLEATMGPAWVGAMVPKAKVVLYEMALDLPDPWLAAVEKAVARTT